MRRHLDKPGRAPPSKNALVFSWKVSPTVAVSKSRYVIARNTRESYTMCATTPADEYERTPESIHIEVGPICAPKIAKGSVIAHASVPSQKMPKTITMCLFMLYTAHTRRRKRNVVAGTAIANPAPRISAKVWQLPTRPTIDAHSERFNKLMRGLLWKTTQPTM